MIQSPAFTAIGVDGCRAGWLAASYDGRVATLQLCPTVAEVEAFIPTRCPIFIDMPIGLVSQGTAGRTCDTLARRYLSPRRHSSVFTAPCRAAVYAEMEEASAVNFSLTGKKLSRQSLNLIPKIRELDAYLQTRPEAEQARWYEAHPEVVFAAFNQGSPLEHGKKTTAGEAQRLALIAGYFPEAERWYGTVRNLFLRKEVLPDDIVDALGLAVAAYLVANDRSKLGVLPDAPPRDATGLPLRIVYAEVG